MNTCDSIYDKGICTYSQMITFTAVVKRFRKEGRHLTLKLDTALYVFLLPNIVSNILFASVLVLTFPC